MPSLATLLLAAGRGDAPDLVGGLLVIVGVIVLASAVFGGSLWVRARRAGRGRGETHLGGDGSEQAASGAGRGGSA